MFSFSFRFRPRRIAGAENAAAPVAAAVLCRKVRRESWFAEAVVLRSVFDIESSPSLSRLENADDLGVDGTTAVGPCPASDAGSRGSEEWNIGLPKTSEGTFPNRLRSDEAFEVSQFDTTAND